MGHIVFVILHLLAIALGVFWLFLTIPGHLIYSAVARKPTPGWSHTRCPSCREVVRRDAIKCMHCGGELTPPKPRALAWRVLDVVVLLVILGFVIDWVRKTT